MEVLQIIKFSEVPGRNKKPSSFLSFLLKMWVQITTDLRDLHSTLRMNISFIMQYMKI